MLNIAITRLNYGNGGVNMDRKIIPLLLLVILGMLTLMTLGVLPSPL
ncbi:hypothetical protein ASZ90_020123 [hydrocarbon metagenome]|uniref:Uncharacterized protein n=1 Tax=hydrocarbon metagenome TaxID=938273 RepID=A0A0W8E1J9_9ZZZZ